MHKVEVKKEFTAFKKGRGYSSGHWTNSLRAIHPAIGNIAHMLLGRYLSGNRTIILGGYSSGYRTNRLCGLCFRLTSDGELSWFNTGWYLSKKTIITS